MSVPITTSVVLIGTKSGTSVTPVALTSSYADNTKTFSCGEFTTAVFEVKYTTGAGETNNSIELKMESSEDGTNFYQLTNEQASGGTSTMTQREFTFVGASAATAYSLSYKLELSYPYLKISAKESGVAANAGSVFIEGNLSTY